MKSNRHQFALAGLAALSLLAGNATTYAAPGDANRVVLSLERIDDCSDPTAEFAILLDVFLPGTGASTVEMASAAGLQIELEEEGDDEWFGESVFTTLNSFANEANGLWTITVTGGTAASTSTFTLDLSDVDMQDFYAPPANVLPASGPIGPNAVFTWDDPTVGQSPADALFVDTDYQAADLSIGETSWTPPLPLTAGGNSFAVLYAYVADFGTVGPLMVTSGTIAWAEPTPLATFGSETITCYEVQQVDDANTIEIALERIDDNIFPDNEFIMFLDLRLEDQTVTGVSVVTAGGLEFDLHDDEDSWDAETGFPDLASMLTAMNGEWTVSVEGPSPSTSTFAMNVGGLTDGDFFDVPTNLFPAHNDAGVPADITVSWDDPTPPGAADFLFVEVGDEDADTVDGSIDIGATSWSPPVDLDLGRHEFFVGYGVFGEFGTASPISVDPPGAIAWGLPSFAPAGHPASSPLVFLASETAAQFIVGAPARFEVSLERIDDAFIDGPFVAFIDAALPGLDATNVEVRTPLRTIPLEQFDGEWEADVPFPDLETMKTELNGTWFIEVFGPNYSLSQFYLDLVPVVEDDFYPTPFDLFPGQGETGVPSDVTFLWSDPTGEDTADFLFVEVREQEASTLDGTLDINDESWTPPQELSPGFNEFYVLYLDVTDPGVASPIWSQGAIGWQTPEYAPQGYPENAPLVLFGSETGVQFEVGVEDCPGDISGDGLVGFEDILGILGNWGCNECPEQDADGDGLVGFSDILLILADWGPCE